MTATALNIASIAPAGQAGAGASANAGATGALAGFEALLGALFPQADPTAAPAAAGLPATATPTTPVNPELLAGDTQLADAVTDATAEPTTDDTTVVASPTAGDAAAALAASLAAAQAATVETQLTTAKNPNAADAASKDTSATTAWGRDKTKGAPAAPALLHANPHARLTEKAADAELAAQDADTGEAAAPAVETETPTTGPAPQAAQRPVATTPPAPVAPQAPVAQATPAADAPQADTAPLPTVAEAPVETPVEAPPAQMASVAALTTRPDATPAPAPAPTNRTTKSERAKAADQVADAASDDLKSLEAADKPAHAKAAQGAAKTASATVEAPETKTDEAKAEPETPDAPVLSEARSTSQAATPAHASQGARGTSETVANLAAHIVKKLEGKATRFDVELNPHGLGKVDVRIEIGAHGKITAGMMFDNPQAAADVKARAAELQRALEQAGFDVSGGISFDVAQDRGQQQQNQAWQDQGDASRAFQGRAFRAALDTAGDAAEAANQGALRLRRGVNSGLDLRI